MIEPGDQAPDFSLPDQDGRGIKLSDFRGEPVVVYFYPKADTPGPKNINQAGSRCGSARPGLGTGARHEHPLRQRHAAV